MEETVLPPSPNWYLPNVLDVGIDGTVAYGTNTNIALMTLTDDANPKVTKLAIITHVHRDRVSVVAFGPPGVCEKMVASIGGDGYVKVWDTTTGLICQVHQKHGAQTKIRGMDWSPANRQQIVSVDETGTFVLYDVGTNRCETVVFPKMRATVLACCPHKWNLVAVGDASGLVYIVSVLGTGSVIYRMRGHETAVVSLSWSPSVGNVFAQGAKRTDPAEMLLASGASSRSIFIWRGGTDGRYQAEIILPTSQPTQGKQRGSTPGAGAPGAYTAVFWAEPTKLLASTKWGEVLCWNLAVISEWQQSYEKAVFNGQNKAFGRTLVNQTHNRTVFSICCKRAKVTALVEPSSTDWRNKEAAPRVLIWTTSQDRLLVGTELNAGAASIVLPTLGGYVYCMAVSRLDSAKVAVGAGDGVIRVWNTASFDAIDLRSVWLQIKGRVTALSWHPKHESWLAFGTSEGRVGVYDMASASKGPVCSWSFHKRSVYTLGWGPISFRLGSTRESTQKHFLYSCGDNMLLCYDVSREDEPFGEMKISCYTDGEPMRMAITEFAWKDDYSILALGTDSGCVYLCKPPNVSVVATLHPHKKAIQCLAWHPMVTTTEPTGSPLHHHLAIASTENTVKILNTENVLTSNCGPDGTGMGFTTLTGHSDRVTRVAWNPHVGGQLVSTSYDGSAQIWDIRNSPRLVSRFDEHTGWVACVMWCPLDADFVITGSNDFTLRMWRVSAHTSVRRAKPLAVFALPAEDAMPVEKAKPKKELAKMWSGRSAAGNEGVGLAIVPTSSQVKKSHFPVSSKLRNHGRESVIDSTYCLLEDKKLKEANKDSVRTPQIGSGELAHLGFFSDSAAMKRTLDLEIGQLKKSNQLDNANNLELWRSNEFVPILKKAISDKSLTLWHLAIAPMVSPRMWRVVTTAFAGQLEEAGRLQEAATMLVATRQIGAAVEMLSAAGFHREAVCIARAHCDPKDPLVGTTLEKWATAAALVGDYELAAQCYVSMDDLERAARVQSQRADSRSLELATLLAHETGNKGLFLSLAEQTVHRLLLERSYLRAIALVTEYAVLQPWVWLILTHSEMVKGIEAIAKPAFVAQNLNHWLGKQEGFESVLEAVALHCTMLCSEIRLADVPVILGGVDRNPTTKHEVQLSIAAFIAASLVVSGTEPKRVYLMKALAVAYRYLLAFPQSRLMLAVIIFVMPPMDFERWEQPDGLQVSIEAYLLVALYRLLDKDAPNSLMQDHADDDVPAIVQATIRAVVTLLPSAVDSRSMFYFCAISQYATYEKLILEDERRRAPRPDTAAAVSEEGAAADVTCREAAASADVADGVDGPSVEPAENVAEAEAETETGVPAPITKLARLRKFEEFFQKSRGSVPNPYAFYGDLMKVLGQYKNVAGVAGMIDKVGRIWKRRELSNKTLLTTMLEERDCSDDSDVPGMVPRFPEIWDAIQTSDQREFL